MNVMYERGNAKTLRKALWYTATHHYKCPLVEQRSTTDNVVRCCRWTLSWNFASHLVCWWCCCLFGEIKIYIYSVVAHLHSSEYAWSTIRNTQCS